MRQPPGRMWATTKSTKPLVFEQNNVQLFFQILQFEWTKFIKVSNIKKNNSHLVPGFPLDPSWQFLLAHVIGETRSIGSLRNNSNLRCRLLRHLAFDAAVQCCCTNFVVFPLVFGSCNAVYYQYATTSVYHVGHLVYIHRQRLAPILL